MDYNTKLKENVIMEKKRMKYDFSVPKMRFLYGNDTNTRTSMPPGQCHQKTWGKAAKKKHHDRATILKKKNKLPNR